MNLSCLNTSNTNLKLNESNNDKDTNEINEEINNENSKESDQDEDEIAEKKQFNKELTAELVAKQKLIEMERQESQKKGAVSYSTYYTYLTSGGKLIGLLFMVSLFALAQVLMIITDYYLIIWSRKENYYSNELEKLKHCYEYQNETIINNITINYNYNHDNINCDILLTKWTVEDYIDQHLNINHHTRRHHFNTYLSKI